MQPEVIAPPGQAGSLGSDVRAVAALLEPLPQSVRDGFLRRQGGLPLRLAQVRFETAGSATNGQAVGRVVLDVRLDVVRIGELLAAAAAAQGDAA